MNRSPSILAPELIIVLFLPTMMSVLLVMSFLHAVAEQQQQQPLPITLPGCPDKCGNISIPFPFGVNKRGCFLDGFQVTCNHSFQPPRLFLQFYPVNESEPTPSFFINGINLPSDGSFHEMDTIREVYSGGDGGGDYPHSSETNRSVLPVELMDISVSGNQARAYGMVRSLCSYSKANNTYKTQRLQRTTLLSPPFKLAEARNVLVGVGQHLKAYVMSTVYHASVLPVLSCDSDTFNAPDLATNGNCSGQGCCQIPVNHLDFYASSSFGVSLEPWNSLVVSYPCSYGMVVEKSSYNFSTEDMVGYDVLPKKFPRGVVPFVIDFAIRDGWSSSCPAAEAPPPPGYACRSNNSYCANATSGGGYVCKCSENYHGNPYIPNGCQDIDECTALPKPCSSANATCVNKIGGYECPCKPGMTGDGKHGTCTEQFPLPAKIAVGPYM